MKTEYGPGELVLGPQDGGDIVGKETAPKTIYTDVVPTHGLEVKPVDFWRSPKPKMRQAIYVMDGNRWKFAGYHNPGARSF